jgi:hypothetical protein
MERAVRTRATPAWSPTWQGPVQQWSAKFIKNNKWRCDRIYDFEDLMQEAHLIFLRISDKYPRIIDPRHFMGLYKVALSNWFNDRASYMQRHGQAVDLGIDPMELCMGHIEEGHAGLLSILLEEAPQELRLALALLAENPEALRTETPTAGQRENLNMKLRRILGLSAAFDLKALLTDLLFN